MSNLEKQIRELQQENKKLLKDYNIVLEQREDYKKGYIEKTQENEKLKRRITYYKGEYEKILSSMKEMKNIMMKQSLVDCSHMIE
jgi:hypothetical protein